MIRPMYLVILADGRTRQQPLTAGEAPAAFAATADGRTVLERAVARLAPLIDPFDVVVVTDRRHGQTVRGLVPKALVLAEPMHRNTAASVALATVAIDRPDDEPMLVVIADHDIDDEEAFRDAIGTIGASLSEGAERRRVAVDGRRGDAHGRRSRPQLHPPTVR